MPLIKLIDAGYKYAGTGKWVFRHFDLAIESGEVLRITGRNGSGKTTLLKVICGLLQLREGELQKGREASTAYMDQFSGEMLARDLTIGEQIKAAACNASARNDSIGLLDAFGLGLDERVGEFIGHLSGGQRQIVALLCTLAANGSVLCLDEFTSSMDEHSKNVAGQLLSYVRASGNVTLIVVGHEHTAMKMDRELSIAANP